MEGQKIVTVVGSGNVAAALLEVLHTFPFIQLNLVARNELTGDILAKKYNCNRIAHLYEINTSSDFLFLCVQDDQILSVCQEIPDIQGIVVHTSGSTDMQVLNKSTHYGVFYPMQTFSKEIDTDWSKVPLYIEGNSPAVEARLLELALILSPKVHFLNSQARMQLHIAAVFACNFTNLMLGSAADIMEQNGLSFSDLTSLVQCTLDKAFSVKNPHQVQTGPAVRNDSGTMTKHLQSLSAQSDLAEMYAFLSKKIIEKHLSKREED